MIMSLRRIGEFVAPEYRDFRISLNEREEVFISVLRLFVQIRYRPYQQIGISKYKKIKRC